MRGRNIATRPISICGLQHRHGVSGVAPSIQLPYDGVYSSLDWHFPAIATANMAFSGIRPGALDFWPHVTSLRYRIPYQTGTFITTDNREFQWETDEVDWTLERIPIHMISTSSRSEVAWSGLAPARRLEPFPLRLRNIFNAAFPLTTGNPSARQAFLIRRMLGQRTSSVNPNSPASFAWAPNTNVFALHAVGSYHAAPDLCIGGRTSVAYGARMRSSLTMRCVPALTIGPTGAPLGIAGLRQRWRNLPDGAFTSWTERPTAFSSSGFNAPWMWMLRERAMTSAPSYIDMPEGWTKRPRFLQLTGGSPNPSYRQGPTVGVADGWGVFDQLGYETNPEAAYAKVPSEEWWRTGLGPMQVQIGFTLTGTGGAGRQIISGTFEFLDS